MCCQQHTWLMEQSSFGNDLLCRHCCHTTVQSRVRGGTWAVIRLTSSSKLIGSKPDLKRRTGFPPRSTKNLVLQGTTSIADIDCNVDIRAGQALFAAGTKAYGHRCRPLYAAAPAGCRLPLTSSTRCCLAAPQRQAAAGSWLGATQAALPLGICTEGVHHLH